jgi:arylsulfatase A
MQPINRRALLAGISALGVAVAASGGLANTIKKRKPNIIVVLTDDLGYGDIGAYGGTVIKTPYIDRMANEGVRFTDFYAAQNICTPSRAGLLTGRYPIRTGLGYEVILAHDKRGLPLSEVCIPQALKPDYASALIGKWHLGHVAPYWPPTDHGFDYFFGIPYSHDMLPLALYTDRGHGNIKSEPVVYPELQRRFFDQAEQYIDEQGKNPFFLLLALSAPHLPEHPNAEFAGHSAGAYGDVVEEIDAGVGRLLAGLKRRGIDEDTLVIFTSDNGPWFEGSSGGLRDRKGGGAFDGGYRVPGIFRWPGTIKPAQVNHSVVSSVDFLPTFCALAGKAPPRGVELDGINITDVLEDGTTSPREELILFNNEDVWGIRTPKWKLVVSTYNRGRQVHLDQIEGFIQLYDVNGPTGESYNVADRHPEVVKTLLARVAAARTKFDPMRKGPVPLGYQGVDPKAPTKD